MVFCRVTKKVGSLVIWAKQRTTYVVSKRYAQFIQSVLWTNIGICSVIQKKGLALFHGQDTVTAAPSKGKTMQSDNFFSGKACRKTSWHQPRAKDNVWVCCFHFFIPSA